MNFDQALNNLKETIRAKRFKKINDLLIKKMQILQHQDEKNVYQALYDMQNVLQYTDVNKLTDNKLLELELQLFEIK